MSNHRKLEIARLELIESLRLLAPGTRFGVLFYNLDVERLVGPQLLVATTAASRTEAERRLESVHAMGGTDHVKALRAAFATGAEVVFYLTDGQRLTPTDTERLLKETRGAKVQVIEFGMGPPSPVANPSRILAEKSGGQYRYVNVRDLEGLSDP